MIYDIFYISHNTVNEDSWNIFSSRFPSAQKLNNVQSVEDIKKKSFTKFFWVVWDDLIIAEDFLFDYRVSKYDEEYIHVFRNGKYYDGICLFPKSRTVTVKEFTNRFFIADKKEIDVVASYPKSFDIIFMSYKEPNADENYEKLISRFPRAKRVHGVQGIANAHIEAARIADTDLFWVVDGDAVIVDDFKFEIDQIPQYDSHNRTMVKVWHSKNPINDLEYGYGGVKLLPRKLTLDLDKSRIDVTTSISSNFSVVPEVSNYTMFNTDAYSTWKAAFRECAKLSSRSIDRNYQQETDSRLNTWCTVGEEKEFGLYAVTGAKQGRRYGRLFIGNKEELEKINDFEWLHAQFTAKQTQN